MVDVSSCLKGDMSSPSYCSSAAHRHHLIVGDTGIKNSLIYPETDVFGPSLLGCTAGVSHSQILHLSLIPPPHKTPTNLTNKQ